MQKFAHGRSAKQALGFSETRASDFSRLADKLEGLPKLRGALEEGEIGYTKANKVASVSNEENEEALLEKTRKDGESLPADRADMLLELLASYAETIRTRRSENFRRRKSAGGAGARNGPPEGHQDVRQTAPLPPSRFTCTSAPTARAPRSRPAGEKWR